MKGYPILTSLKSQFNALRNTRLFGFEPLVTSHTVFDMALQEALISRLIGRFTADLHTCYDFDTAMLSVRFGKRTMKVTDNRHGVYRTQTPHYPNVRSRKPFIDLTEKESAFNNEILKAFIAIHSDSPTKLTRWIKESNEFDSKTTRLLLHNTTHYAITCLFDWLNQMNLQTSSKMFGVIRDCSVGAVAGEPSIFITLNTENNKLTKLSRGTVREIFEAMLYSIVDIDHYLPSDFRKLHGTLHDTFSQAKVRDFQVYVEYDCATALAYRAVKYATYRPMTFEEF